MGVEKSEIKMETAAAMADALSTRRVATGVRVNQLRGASEAMKRGSKSVEALAVMLQKDLADGRIEVPKDPIETVKMIQTWIFRARGVLENLADGLTVEGLRAEGELQGLDHAIQEAKRAYDAEAAKAKALREAQEAPPPPSPEAPEAASSRPLGAHPGPSAASRRKAAPAEETEPSAPKPRRRRKPEPEAP